MCQKLKRFRKKLSIWNMTSLGNMHRIIREARDAIADCQKKGRLDINMNRDLLQDLQKLLDLEEKLWRDKSRETMIECDGINSRFFHLSIIYGRKRIKINTIRNKDNAWVEERDQIESTIIKHFKDLFTSSNPDLIVFDLNVMNPGITGEDNNKLTKDVTLEEIQEALYFTRSSGILLTMISKIRSGVL